MIHRRRSACVGLFGLALLLGVTACGSDGAPDDGADRPSESSESVDHSPSDTASLPTDVEPPADAGVLDSVDDVCELVDPAAVESVLGTAMSVVTPNPSGCVVSNGEIGSTAVSVSVSLVPSDHAGTPLEACRFVSRPFVSVEATTIGDLPAFSGIDLGSSGFTAQACAPRTHLVVTGDTLTREQALAIAELALTAP